MAHLLFRRGFYGALLLLLWLCVCARPARADVGLVIEGASGEVGFFSDMGHSSVWVSRGCVDAKGTVYFCEGSSGVVLSGTPAWQQPGAAAIPAEFYFLGPEDRASPDPRADWTNTLDATYPTIGADNGQKYLGRVWIRETRVLVFHTTPEEDRAAIARIQPQRESYHYRATRDNCSDYTIAVLRLWLGDRLKTRRWSDAWISTPRGVERGLVDSLGKAPRGPLRTYTFPNPKRWKQRRPARDICEAALLDPKYAVALIFLQPTAYIGFGGCYGYTRIRTRVQSWRRHGTKTNIAANIKGKTPDEVFEKMTSSPSAMASEATAGLEQ